MRKSRRNVRIYWLQFVISAIWVGVVEVLLQSQVSMEIRRFIIDILIILTGVLAFEPVGRHIFKYLLIGVGASLLIQLLRKVGVWYMSSGPGFWKMGGPIIALCVITIILYFIGVITQKDKMKI
ncbi:hypothetical protein KAH81_05515 [bacterium]|nr:hypothetical protein [bacterium]